VAWILSLFTRSILGRAAARWGSGFALALSAPPLGRCRASLQPEPMKRDSPYFIEKRARKAGNPRPKAQERRKKNQIRDLRWAKSDWQRQLFILWLLCSGFYAWFMRRDGQSGLHLGQSVFVSAFLHERRRVSWGALRAPRFLVPQRPWRAMLRCRQPSLVARPSTYGSRESLQKVPADRYPHQWQGSGAQTLRVKFSELYSLQTQ
jgi:hypothetical protein